MSKNKINWSKIFPKRPAISHKGDYGKVFICAGSAGMLGAAVLCSRGALRTGPGLVYLGVPEISKEIVNLATPEVIVLGGEKAQDFSTIMLKADAIAVGPGLGSRRKLAKQILNKLNAARTLSPVILDADGLNAFSGELTALAKYNLNLILTPHPGELARLLNVKTEIIQKNREKFARETARIIKGIVVLKGDQTVVADQTGQIYINQTGNPGLASGGIGDVLTGMIAGLCAQKVPAWEAAIAGVYLHGLAGDLAAKAKGEYSLIASDLVEKIPDAIQSLG